MKVILEIFYSKPPLHHREIILRKEGTDAKELITIGEDLQSDAEHIYYHILFQGQPPRREADDGPLRHQPTV